MDSGDSRQLYGNFSRNAGAKRLGCRPSCGNHRGYFAHQRAQPQGGADPAAPRSSFELLDSLVGRPVDLIELSAGMVDELGDFIDDVRHALVEIGLIHHGQCVAHIHALYAVDHVTGVLQIETVR